MQKSILSLGPLSDLASQIVDAAQNIKTANSRGIEQLHEYARSLGRQTTTIGLVDFLFLGRLGNR